MEPRRVDYLAGFPAQVRERAAALKEQGLLEGRLLERYPGRHDIQNNALLYSYVQDLKRTWMRSSDGQANFDPAASSPDARPDSASRIGTATAITLSALMDQA